MTIKQFVEKHMLRLQAVSVPETPYKDSHNDLWKADHWYCKLSFVENMNKRTFITYYSKGIGLRKVVKPHLEPTAVKPTIEELLECLHSDFDCMTGYRFEEWARELGYDVDSRQAEKIYNTICEQWRDFQEFLGHAATGEFMAIDINEQEEQVS